jgi:hypothetical protein
VEDSRPDEDEARLDFSFRLSEDRLVLQLEGPPAEIAEDEQELGRAIIDATVDEAHFAQGRTHLVKFLAAAGS